METVRNEEVVLIGGKKGVCKETKWLLRELKVEFRRLEGRVDGLWW